MDNSTLGKRIDTLAVIDSILFVLEFKVGDKQFARHAIDQVWDYALDLKNFHETSHEAWIAPILISTEAKQHFTPISFAAGEDRLIDPILTNSEQLSDVIEATLAFAEAPQFDIQSWERGRYQPTPTIVEAATALYRGHAVEDISRSDAGAINLTQTTQAVAQIIQQAKIHSQKVVAFVTGVPGAGRHSWGSTWQPSTWTPKRRYTVFFSQVMALWLRFFVKLLRWTPSNNRTSEARN